MVMRRSLYRRNTLRLAMVSLGPGLFRRKAREEDTRSVEGQADSQITWAETVAEPLPGGFHTRRMEPGRFLPSACRLKTVFSV